jgi:hypothetical protein
MKRPSKPKRKRRIRAHVLHIYLSERELELLRAAAAKYDLGTSTWARLRLLELADRL